MFTAALFSHVVRRLIAVHAILCMYRVGSIRVEGLVDLARYVLRIVIDWLDQP